MVIVVLSFISCEVTGLRLSTTILGGISKFFVAPLYSILVAVIV